MMTTEQLKFDEKAVLEMLNTGRIWWTSAQLVSALKAVGVPTTRLGAVLNVFVRDGYVLLESNSGYALSKDGRALLEGWDNPKPQAPLQNLLKGVPAGANYFDLSWSPDRHNWRAEIDNMTHTEFSDHDDPVEAVKAVLEQWRIYTDSRPQDADYE